MLIEVSAKEVHEKCALDAYFETMCLELLEILIVFGHPDR